MNALASSATAPVPLMLALQTTSQGHGLALVPGTSAPSASQRRIRSVSLEDALRCIFTRWKSGLLAALLASSAIFLFMTGKVPQYAAEASLVMRVHDGKVFNFDKVVSESLGAHGAPFQLNNHRVQLKSRRFMEYYFAALTPAERSTVLAPPASLPLAARLMASLQSEPEQSAPAADADPADQQREQFIALLSSGTADFIKETYMLRVTARHHDPGTAAWLANAWVRHYIDYAGREENSTALHATAFLREQAGDLRKRVETSETQLAAYRTEKGLVESLSDKTTGDERLKMLTTELAKSELELSRVQETLRQIAACRNDVEKLLSVAALATAPDITTLRPEVTAKLREKELIDAEYGPRHPARTAFYNEFDALRGEISTALRRNISEAQNTARGLTTEVANLKKQITAASSTVLTKGEDAVQYNLLKGQLDADRALYDKVMASLNEASVSSAFSEVTSLRPAEKAVAPGHPATPNKPMSMVLAGAGFGTIFIAVPLLLALAGALRKNGLSALFTGDSPAPATLAAPTAAAPTTGPVLHEAAAAAAANYPDMPQAPATAPETLGTMEVLGSLPALTPTAPGRPDLMLAGLFRAGDSTARTAFETTAARLAACATPGKNVVLITSRTAGEGKSFTAAALGVAILAQGKSALIIDASLRRPSLAAWLPGQAGGATIWDIVASDGRLALDLQTLRCGASNLFTLTAGGASSAPAAAFSRPWFPGLMKFLTDRVDVVILDAPPLDENPENALLAAAAHQAIIVCNKSISDSNDVLTAATRLTTSLPDLQIAGCLLNDGPLPATATTLV